MHDYEVSRRSWMNDWLCSLQSIWNCFIVGKRYENHCGKKIRKRWIFVGGGGGVPCIDTHTHTHTRTREAYIDRAGIVSLV